MFGAKKASLKTVVVVVEHGRHGMDFLGEQAQIELGVAGLDHAAQQARRFQAACGVVDIGAVAAHVADMAGLAFVLGHQLATQGQVSTSEKAALRPSHDRGQTAQRSQCPEEQGFAIWHPRAPSWPRSVRRPRSGPAVKAWAPGPICPHHRL